MTDENDGNSRGLELANHFKENRNFMIIQGGGRLIHDHKFGAETDSPSDRNHLLDRGAVPR